ncbi:MAG: cell division protein FtsZ [Candidatus Thermoplasmatota archaeon]|nr:cell division protein FtsZ [Candidatus Thermoplasmatota archaeon]
MEALLESAVLSQEKIDYTELGIPKIFVVGIGGAGSNSVTRLNRLGIKGATTVAINTDHQHLKITEADKKILIGAGITHGLGAGGYPAIGEHCALLARNEIEEVLSPADLVFTLAGLGGGTGTGVTPVVAEIAKKKGAVLVAIVTTPFDFELGAGKKRALACIEKLRRISDSLIILDNNKLIKFFPNLPLEKGFLVMDQLIAEAVKGLSESITGASEFNLDYADVKTILTGSGLSVMLYGESFGDPDKVVIDTLNHPFLDVDYKGAVGALIHITGGKNLTIRDLNKIVEGITKELDSQGSVKWGARIDESCGDRIKVMSIVTGVQSPQIFSPLR